jgi:hypothetical protein
MLHAGLMYVLQNMMQGIIHKDNELITEDKLLKNSNNQTATSRLYISAKRVSCYCQKGSPFEKGIGRSDT